MSDVDGVATKSEWNQIYTRLFAPAIRAAGFDAVQSKATRGNLVGGIIEDLWAADAVLADLTGQKSNVFYELGVRHALRGKSIIVARRAKDIPSDLSGYARHIYSPDTKRGQAAFRRCVGGLLQHILEFPDRPDNPVEDFLRDSLRIHSALRLGDLTTPQRSACLNQIAHCEKRFRKSGKGEYRSRAERPNTSITL